MTNDASRMNAFPQGIKSSALGLGVKVIHGKADARRYQCPGEGGILADAQREECDRNKVEDKKLKFVTRYQIDYGNHDQGGDSECRILRV